MYLRVGISLPTIEVRFEHLKIAAETHVGGRALPSVFNYCVNVVEVLIDYTFQVLAYVFLLLISLFLHSYFCFWVQRVS